MSSCVHHTSTLVSEDLALYLLPSARPSTLDQMEFSLVFPTIGLYQSSSTSQTAERPIGVLHCFISLKTQSARGGKAHWVLLQVKVFLEEVQGYICPRPNTHETLNSTELFKMRGLASLWLTITLKACCISFILAVFQSSWETENNHTAVQPLLTQPGAPIPDTRTLHIDGTVRYILKRV